MLEINRLSDMLNSKDIEMQNLGLITMYSYSDCEKLLIHRSEFIAQAKRNLCFYAYIEGQKAAKQFLNGTTKNQPDAAL